MFAKHIEKSNIIELIEDELDEEGSAYRATLRVLPKMQKQWVALVRDILSDASTEDVFDLEPHKAYFLSEKGDLQYVWVLLIWGDLKVAETSLSDLLSRRYEPVKPKSKDPRMRPTVAGRSRRRVVELKELEDGSRLEVVAFPIPHTRQDRLRYTASPNEKVDLHSARARFGATAANRGERAFAPSKEREV